MSGRERSHAARLLGRRLPRRRGRQEGAEATRAERLRLRGAGVLPGRRLGRDEHPDGRASFLVVWNHRTVRFHRADWTAWAFYLRNIQRGAAGWLGRKST